MSNNKRMKNKEEQILQVFKDGLLECLKDVTLTSAQTNHIYRCYLFALEKGFISNSVNWLPSYIFYKNVLSGLAHAKISIDVHEEILALYQQVQKTELDYANREEMKSSKKSNYINTMFYSSN